MTQDQTRNAMEVSTATVGNAVEVVSQVIVNIAGNDISNKLNGANITLNSVRDLAIARFNYNLNRK